MRDGGTEGGREGGWREGLSRTRTEGWAVEVLVNALHPVVDTSRKERSACEAIPPSLPPSLPCRPPVARVSMDNAAGSRKFYDGHFLSTQGT